MSASPLNPEAFGAQSAKPTHARFWMLALVFFATVINYLDRTNLSVAAPSLAADLHIGAASTGFLFSAFAWSYALCNLPGGYLVDRLGARCTYAVSLLAWSAATALQGGAHSLRALLGLRLLVGVAEAPAFPANNRVVTLWFPTQERGTATSCYVSAQYIGTGLCTPLLFWIAATWGWRAIFWVTGSFGIFFSVIWWLLYRDPASSRLANGAELASIKAGGAGAMVPSGTTFRWSDVGRLLSHRQIWAVCIGKFSVSVAIFFLLTWFPSYLIHERGLTLLKVGGYAMAPYLSAATGVWMGGLWSDALLKRGTSQTRARKIPIVTGFLLTSIIFLANFTTSNLATVAVIAAAFFFSGVSSIGWAVTSDIAPLKLIGTTGGIVNFAANLAGIVTPIAIGYIVQATSSYFWALALVAAVPAILGVFAYTVVLGEIRRIELDP